MDFFFISLLIHAVMKVAKTERLQSFQKHWIFPHFAEMNFLKGPADHFWSHRDFPFAKVLRPSGLYLKHSESLKNYRDMSQ